MNTQQLLENMLNFSMQQHVAKDAVISELQKKVADLQKQVDDINSTTLQK